MYCYERIFSGIGWCKIADMVGLFASLCYNEYVEGV